MKMLWIVALLILSSAVLAQTIIRDMSYAGDGELNDNNGSFKSALTADDKLVVFHSTTTDIGFSRYNKKGQIDASFGTGGTIWYSNSAFSSYFIVVEDIAIQPDDKILITGYDHDQFIDEKSMLLWRFNADGSVDTGFNHTGLVKFEPLTRNPKGKAIALYSDGRILVSGTGFNMQDYPGYSSNVTDLALWRYMPDGSPDTSFSGDGISGAEYNLPNNNNPSFVGTYEVAMKDLIISEDEDSIYVGVGGQNSNGPDNIGAYVFHSSGAFDRISSTYLSGDRDISYWDSEHFTIMLQPDGKVITAINYQVGADNRIGLGRSNADYYRTWDSTFLFSPILNSGGQQMNMGFEDIEFYTDGLLIAGVSFHDVFSNQISYMTLLKTDEDGHNDYSFHNGNFFYHDTLGYQPYDMHIQSDGNILVVGNSLARRYGYSFPVGINEQADVKALLYPNPANGITILKLNRPVSELVNVRVCDLTGKAIQNHTIGAGAQSVQLNTSSLASGIYLVQVKGEGIVLSKKLIVQ